MPRAGYRAEKRRTCSQFAAISVAVGSASAIATNPLSGLALGLGTGIELALLRSPWTTYVIALAISVLNRQLPLQLMVVLRDARGMELLKTAGANYQFRHADFQDYLAP